MSLEPCRNGSRRLPFRHGSRDKAYPFLPPACTAGCGPGEFWLTDVEAKMIRTEMGRVRKQPWKFHLEITESEEELRAMEVQVRKAAPKAKAKAKGKAKAAPKPKVEKPVRRSRKPRSRCRRMGAHPISPVASQLWRGSLGVPLPARTPRCRR